MSPAVFGTEIAAYPAAGLRAPFCTADVELTDLLIRGFGTSTVGLMLHASQTRSSCLTDLEAAS